MNDFNRIFGSGPVGLSISIILLLLSNYLRNTFNIPEIFADHYAIRLAIFIILTAVSIAVVGWSFKSLNPMLRGRNLIRTGAFKYFRHPLYGAFLTFFDFGLAILLNNWVFVCWAFLLHPIWHFLVKREENVLTEAFPNDYEEYCKVTGRFFPRLITKKQ
ncbi:MAG TPA: isoprenylcysteine carboxylmethyltransferase family protein [Candidatus Acidoferrales bacterium]|nr:isoprenylcysteine carboxylmethyltransferase family protein [Candidatus Acidoferrales bacterium]